MYCTQCGAQNDDRAAFCTQCRATLVPAGSAATGPSQVIPNYLVQAILVTLCCCLIPGIVAIVYAAQVNGLMAGGRFTEARRSSRLAYIWSWVGFGLGVLYLMVCGAFVVFSMMLGQ